MKKLDPEPSVLAGAAQHVWFWNDLCQCWQLSAGPKLSFQSVAHHSSIFHNQASQPESLLALMSLESGTNFKKGISRRQHGHRWTHRSWRLKGPALGKYQVSSPNYLEPEPHADPRSVTFSVTKAKRKSPMELLDQTSSVQMPEPTR